MRFLNTGFGEPSWNMGLDEAVLESVSRGGPSTLRFYGWKPKAVSLGYFQCLEDVVDEESCGRDAVEVVRRITGGGAVYHDVELTYSVIAPRERFAEDILESYRQICEGLIQGLRVLGVKAYFAPLNDVVAGSKKVSGNAQTRRKGCILQHGTVLLDVDVDSMFTYLKVPDEKLRDKMIGAAKDRVTSLKHLNRETSFDKAVEAFRQGFIEAFGEELEDGKPSNAELSRACELAKNRYASTEWTHKR